MLMIKERFSVYFLLLQEIRFSQNTRQEADDYSYSEYIVRTCPTVRNNSCFNAVWKD